MYLFHDFTILDSFSYLAYPFSFLLLTNSIHFPPTLPLVVDLSHAPFLPFAPTYKSTRVHKPPSLLQDFVCITTHWCNLVHFTSLPASHQSLLSSHSQWLEPKSYKLAAQDPLWVKAMDTKFQAL